MSKIQNNAPSLSRKDKEILIRLVRRLAEIAADPVMPERKRLWKALHAFHPERPMILTEPPPAELFPPESLQCEGEWSRGREQRWRWDIFIYEQVHDDTVVEPRITYGNKIIASGFGVEAVVEKGDDGKGHGSVRWDAPLKYLKTDMKRLHFQTFTFDRAGTLREKELLEDVSRGILPVVNRSMLWWTQGLTGKAIKLLGLEAFMMAMYDQPDELHELMAFLRDDQMHLLDFCEREGLLTLNNENDYVGSGGCGYIDRLPQPDYIPNAPVRLKDLWGLSESQETVSVSPAMFAEFVFPYLLPLISRFGLAYYGCCEPVHDRWPIIKRIPNLHTVSIAPWADQEKMVEFLGRNYGYARKPNPAYISTPQWNEALIWDDLRKTITLTKGLNLELDMKDVHTLCNEPWRLGRWVQIARDIIADIYG